jgi:hypothetical protein
MHSCLYNEHFFEWLASEKGEEEKSGNSSVCHGSKLADKRGDKGRIFCGSLGQIEIHEHPMVNGEEIHPFRLIFTHYFMALE